MTETNIFWFECSECLNLWSSDTTEDEQCTICDKIVPFSFMWKWR